MAIKDEILEQLLKGYEKPEDLLGKDGIFQEMKKALLEKWSKTRRSTWRWV